MTIPALFSPKAPAWYVVETRPNVEVTVAGHLAEKDFTAYLPLETRLRRVRHRRVRVAAPVIPRFVFVELHHCEKTGAPLDLDLIRELDGVVGLVGIAGAPRPIPTWWLEVIMAGESAGAFDFCPRGRPNYEAGNKVRITEGPLAALIGEFICTTKDGRIKILMEALSSAPPKRVKIRPDQVEPLEAEPAVTLVWPDEATKKTA
jgi:transcriptional antiterminator RfaH